MSLPAPVHVYQLDGSPWARSACMGAAAAMALDAYTGGAIRVGQAAIRANQDDQQGGIGLDDVATAWRRGWGLSFAHGPTDWPTIRSRLARGDGVVITANYGALRTWRAPGSTFTGAHALYLASLATIGGTPDGAAKPTPAVVVHDPLRRSVATIPESVVRLAWTGGAGWGKGTYAGAAGGPAGAPLGAFYRGGTPLVVYPRGSTAWTAAAIMGILNRASYFGADLDLAAGAAEDVAKGILKADEGRPWTEALHAEWAAELGSAAVTAGNPGAALTAALGALPARAGIVLGLVALGVLGVWLTFREPLSVVVPAPVRRFAP